MANETKKAVPAADPRSFELVLGDNTSRTIKAVTVEEAVAKAKQAKDAVLLKDRYDGRTVWKAGA